MKLRQILFTHKELAVQLKRLEQRMDKYDGKIRVIFQTIYELMGENKKDSHKIGFLRNG